jgi:hypothetical protein
MFSSTHFIYGKFPCGFQGDFNVLNSYTSLASCCEDGEMIRDEPARERGIGRDLYRGRQMQGGLVCQRGSRRIVPHFLSPLADPDLAFHLAKHLATRPSQ